jgi:nucleoside-diphosphate-sugar epimerase
LNRLHRQMLAVNVDGARNVAEAAARAGVRRLVHTSSISAAEPVNLNEARFGAYY